jgi:hypothetical protein
MGLRGWGYLPVRVRTSFRRSTVNAMLAAMTMRPSVAARLPGATQLMQLPIIAGVSYIERPLSCKTSLPRWPAISGIQSFTFGAVVLDTVEPRPRAVAPHPLCRQEERWRRTDRQRTLRQRTALAREYTAADVDERCLLHRRPVGGDRQNGAPGGTKAVPRQGLARMTGGRTPASAEVMHSAPAMPENRACIKPRPAFEFRGSLD